MTGDVESGEQADLVHDFGDGLDVEVLKVPHHGSGNFSSYFVEATEPEYAIVSCGKDNSYGHPDPDTLDAYEEVGAIVCRTDQGGDVTVVTDGVAVSFGCADPW
jgi:competence protein ComEC